MTRSADIGTTRTLPHIAVRKYFYAPVRRVLWRRKRLFFQSARSTIPEQCIN